MPNATVHAYGIDYIIATFVKIYQNIAYEPLDAITLYSLHTQLQEALPCCKIWPPEVINEYYIRFGFEDDDIHKVIETHPDGLYYGVSWKIDNITITYSSNNWEDYTTRVSKYDLAKLAKQAQNNLDIILNQNN